MERREKDLTQLLPSDIGFGIDRQWLRAWPMEQIVTKGSILRLSAQITGHGTHTVTVKPILPWDSTIDLTATIHTDGETSGSTEVGNTLVAPDKWVHFDIKLPEDLRGTYLIPYDCWLEEQYLGSFTNCTVQII